MFCHAAPSSSYCVGFAISDLGIRRRHRGSSTYEVNDEDLGRDDSLNRGYGAQGQREPEEVKLPHREGLKIGMSGCGEIPANVSVTLRRQHVSLTLDESCGPCSIPVTT